jgi:hypothetical protein
MKYNQNKQRDYYEDMPKTKKKNLKKRIQQRDKYKLSSL